MLFILPIKSIHILPRYSDAASLEWSTIIWIRARRDEVRTEALLSGHDSLIRANPTKQTTNNIELKVPAQASTQKLTMFGFCRSLTCLSHFSQIKSGDWLHNNRADHGGKIIRYRFMEFQQKPRQLAVEDSPISNILHSRYDLESNLIWTWSGLSTCVQSMNNDALGKIPFGASIFLFLALPGLPHRAFSFLVGSGEEKKRKLFHAKHPPFFSLTSLRLKGVVYWRT